MNQRYRRAAADARRNGRFFATLALIMTVGTIGCAIHRSVWITVVFGLIAVFTAFISSTLYMDASIADDMAEHYETEDDHDHIEL